MKRHKFISILCIFILAACKPKSQGDTESTSFDSTSMNSAFDIEVAWDTIEAINKRSAAAMAAGDSAVIVSLYTSDAAIKPANLPANKKTATASGTDNETWRMGVKNIKYDAKDHWGNHELLGEEGTYSIADERGRIIDKGKYQMVWRMEEGRWKLLKDIFDSDLAKK